VEQGLCELEADKEKELNTMEAESSAAPVAYQSPSADSFIFDPSFSMLPDLLDGNTLYDIIDLLMIYDLLYFLFVFFPSSIHVCLV
jgi:hypothetical protein